MIIPAAGAGLAGILVDTLGSSILVAAAAIIYVAAGLLAWVLLSKPLSRLAAQAAA